MKRLLALDGGGIKGMASLQVLRVIESQMRAATGRPDAVLADHFHYIGGTSTGSLTAACLSLGMDVTAIRDFYYELSKKIFAKRPIWRRHLSKFHEQGLTQIIHTICTEQDGSQMTLGSDRLKTFLLIVTRNATTGSPWPLTNNPNALYNKKGQAGCNLDFPLWQVLRASCAAPVFFQPERVLIKGDEGKYKKGVECFFEDGGMTPFNNPAFLLYLKATLPEYRMNWAVGLQNLALTSIGTGSMPMGMAGDKSPNILRQVAKIPASLIRAFQDHQDFLCRMQGQCFFGPKLDSELGYMKRENAEAKFRYTRYEPKFGDAEIAASKRISKHGISMDNIELIDYLSEVGEAYANEAVRFEDWNG